MELLFILAAVLLIEMTAKHEQKLLDYRNCYIYSLPQEVRYHFPASLFGAVCKRLFDIIVSLAVLLTVFPLIFLIAAPLIKLTSSGPIFFTQKRLGLYAELFDCYKFRTMYTNPGAEPVRKNDSRDRRYEHRRPQTVSGRSLSGIFLLLQGFSAAGCPARHNRTRTA